MPDKSEKLDTSKKRKWLIRIIGSLLIGLLILMLFGVLYEQRMRSIVAKRFPPQGELVDVDGRIVHIRAEGTGTPTVLFEPGAGMVPGAYWGDVQKEVSRFARTIGYDKSGLGWSEATTGPRTSNDLSIELHALLQATNEEGPFVLVGSSLGGVHVRVFADRYPELVAGMVLVDSTPNWDERLVEYQSKSQSPADQLVRGDMPLWKSLSYDLAAETGLLRLAFGNDWVGAAFLPQSLDAFSREFRGCLQSLRQAQSAKGIDGKPLVVICAGQPSGHIPGKLWRELQRDLTTISNNSRFVMAENSDHNIEDNQPEIIVEAIRDVVESVRAGTSLVDTRVDMTKK